MSLKLYYLDYDDEGDELLDSAAEDGWQLKETVEIDGSTSYLIFERPVKE
jgi:hypothetical protein